jgi:hypothetical protein
MVDCEFHAFRRPLDSEVLPGQSTYLVKPRIAVAAVSIAAIGLVVACGSSDAHLDKVV